MAPTEGQQKESEALKLKGNESFKKKEYSAAHNFYTAAISLTPTSAALYSNRSATLLCMNQPHLALGDANRAVQLDPRWPKAYRRKGSVLEALEDFGGAREVYDKSLEVALEGIEEQREGGEETTRRRRKAAVEEVEVLLQALEKRRHAKASLAGKVMTIADSPGPRVMAEFERRCAAGEPMGSWPPNGSCLRRIWVAEMQFLNALQNLSQFTQGQIPGAPPGVVGIYGRVQTLEELTTALLEDIRVVRITQDTLDKLALCYKLEQQQRNAIGPGMSPKETIAEYNRRLTQPASAARMGFNGSGGPPRAGWDVVRPALQLSIRSAIMNGCLYSLDLAPGKEEAEFRRAVDLIEEARRTWRNVDGSIRGRTLEETFLRGVKALLADSIVRSYPKEPPGHANANASAATAVKRRKLDEIRSIGEWLCHSFSTLPKPPDAAATTTTTTTTTEKTEKTHPRRPRDDADPWWNIYYAHYVSPFARGTAFVAFAHTQLALDFLSGPARTASLTAGAKEYATAAAWMSPDDPERINRALNAVFALAAAQAPLYKSDVAAVLAMAEKAKDWYKPYFTQTAHLDSHLGWAAGLEATALAQQRPVPTADTLALTAVMRQAWQARIANGETEEAVGGRRIWNALGPEVLDALDKDGLGWDP